MVKVSEITPQCMMLVPARSVKPRRQKTRNPGRNSDPVTKVTSSLSQLLGNPYTITAFGLCALLAFTHAKDPATSIIKQVVDKLNTTEATKPLGKFLSTHLKQTLGLACYAITIWLVAPIKQRLTLTAAAAVAAFLIPESSPYQYLAQSFALCLYLKTRDQVVRTIVVGAAAVVYSMGWLT